MFENIGWPEILVLVVAGLFILGPERLPEAAAWVGRTIRQVKDYATGARDHLKNEMGSDFEHLQQPLNDLRSLRNLNPKAAITRTLFSDDDEGPTKPNGHAPGPNGSTGGATTSGATNGGATNGSPTNGSATNGSATNGAASTGSVTNGTPAPTAQAPLTTGERPPIDSDAT